MKIIGNTGPGFGEGSVATGSGRPRQRSPFGHIVISGETGESTRISVADLYPKFDQLFQGILVQCTGGNVQIDTTLVNADLAMNPQQDTDGAWVADTALTPGSIQKLAHLCTALRITFTTKAVLYIMGA